jgi:hypothetical protein
VETTLTGDTTGGDTTVTGDTGAASTGDTTLTGADTNALSAVDQLLVSEYGYTNNGDGTVSPPARTTTTVTGDTTLTGDAATAAEIITGGAADTTTAADTPYWRCS